MPLPRQEAEEARFPASLADQFQVAACSLMPRSATTTIRSTRGMATIRATARQVAEVAHHHEEYAPSD